jgi:hypothetical protein
LRSRDRRLRGAKQHIGRLDPVTLGLTLPKESYLSIPTTAEKSPPNDLPKSSPR